ncbi:MAG TPA: RluA family pseudouridine synthase [Vicinamibacteria bacterium]
MGARADPFAFRRRVAPAEAGLRLADVLARWLPGAASHPVPMARVRALVAAGAVRVNGAVVRVAGRPVRAGQLVDAALRLERLRSRAAGTDRPFRLTGASILYRDDVLLAVDKPPGLPTHATADPSRPSLVGHVVEHLRGAAAPYVGVHQRLDRDTSGIVLLATDPRANAGLARAFEGRQVEKTYLALTARPLRLPPRRLRIDAPLATSGAGEADARGPRGRVTVGGPRAKPARTDVVVREVLASALLVEARPRTGRKHQVRAHLAHAGLPVLGDPLYGDGRGPARLMLHASRLSLPHPVTGRPLVIESPLPPDFEAALARARGKLG